MDYFKLVFTTSCPKNIDQIFQTMDNKITEKVNATLVREFKVEEIKNALDQMHPDKTSRPDGMIGCFYK